MNTKNPECPAVSASPRKTTEITIRLSRKLEISCMPIQCRSMYNPLLFNAYTGQFSSFSEPKYLLSSMVHKVGMPSLTGSNLKAKYSVIVSCATSNLTNRKDPERVSRNEFHLVRSILSLISSKISATAGHILAFFTVRSAIFFI